MKVKALRGVCIGVDRHLKVGDVEELDPATVTFLVSIGAVERVVEKPKPSKPEPKPEPAPEPISVPTQSGKKEK